MWLPRNERKVLHYLYSKDGSAGLGSPRRRSLADFQTICSDKNSAEAAASILNERKLVILRETDEPKGHIDIGLRVEGYDLARQYSHWFTRSGLWFREHKDHWIWLIVSFLGGVLASLVVQWLSD